jgi:hypothetical protein
MAPGFPNRLRVEQIDDTHWRVLEAFEYDSDVLHARLILPAGFETDFASVPRVPVAYWLFGDTAHAAAVVHDYLYTTGLFPKATADSVFFEAMKASGVPFWRRWWMYEGVHLLGGAAWTKHRKEDHA